MRKTLHFFISISLLFLLVSCGKLNQLNNSLTDSINSLDSKKTIIDSTELIKEIDSIAIKISSIKSQRDTTTQDFPNNDSLIKSSSIPGEIGNDRIEKEIKYMLSSEDFKPFPTNEGWIYNNSFETFRKNLSAIRIFDINGKLMPFHFVIWSQVFGFYNENKSQISLIEYGEVRNLPKEDKQKVFSGTLKLEKEKDKIFKYKKKGNLEFKDFATKETLINFRNYEEIFELKKIEENTISRLYTIKADIEVDNFVGEYKYSEENNNKSLNEVKLKKKGSDENIGIIVFNNDFSNYKIVLNE